MNKDKEDCGLILLQQRGVRQGGGAQLHVVKERYHSAQEVVFWEVGAGERT